MKQHFKFGLIFGMAFLLLLPIYAGAQTKLILESSTGDRIGAPSIKSYAMGTDGTLVIYLSDPFNFQSLLPDISVEEWPGGDANCVITKPAYVTATQGAIFGFRVTSATPGTTFSMVVNPDPGVAKFNFDQTLSAWLFAWNTTGNPPVPVGSYLAVFEATDGVHTSQLVVMIKINPPETVTTPMISGPSTGYVGQSVSFSASSTSSLGHPLEYQFDWGDSSTLTWGSAPQTHVYNSENLNGYNVKAQARCTQDLVESGWSDTKSITISNAPLETITTPIFTTAPTSGTTGQPVSFTASATSSVGHPLQYRFTWGDGSTSSWGSATLTYTYNTANTYSVTVQAKCQTDGVTSSVSYPTQITISSGTGGGTGTKTNPIKLNLYTTATPTPGYSLNTNGDFSIFAGQTIYFEFDSAYTGQSVSLFTVNVNGYNYYNYNFYRCKIVRATGSFVYEDVPFTQHNGLTWTVRDSDLNVHRYLLAVYAPTKPSVNPKIWVQVP
ncbi:MAG: hypothetical protein A2156_03500 [Deltaproteobacteria bacterium RBG_16_48_10]|nr:MAG: hypothetical protein A2156_03500 [Deltaproteobacteria bacterium RBG_16_48_10]